MPREPLIAGAAALVLAAAIAWLVLVRPGPIAVPAPERPSGSLAIAALQLPEIGGFEQYDVNADNPFVPYHERIRASGPPPSAPGPIPPRPPAGVPIPPAPPLHLPPAQPGGGDAPRVVGFVRGGELAAGLLVVLPGQPQVRRMQVGERIGRWMLRGIEAGSIADFTDESGRGYRLLIAPP